MQYGMVIDLKKCMGCQTCVTSCKLANNLPKNFMWNTVYTEGGTFIDTAGGTYPNCTLQHRPVACQHCRNPLCVSVCPTGASARDAETGLVTVDNSICIGCLSCIEACPYNVRVFYESEPAYTMDFAVGYANAPTHVANTVDKCTFCKNLLDEGQTPMCVQACIGYARYFGDLDDPESEVAKLVASREYEQYLDEFDTSPAVYFLT